MRKSKSSMQKASRLSAISIPIALAICLSLLLVGHDVEKAFAVASISLITPTGGDLSATSDCSDISAGQDIIWLNCNSVLYAISDSTHQVIANITSANIVNHLASTSGTSVIAHDNVGNDLIKYTLEGASIIQTNIWSAPCNTDLDMNYDSSGYIWQTCSADNRITAMNPNTFTTYVFSQDLTGESCTNPDRISFGQIDGMGVIHCTNGGAADSITTFARTTNENVINVLDSEITTSGTVNVMIDASHDRILAPNGNTMVSWTYTNIVSGGALTAETSIIGQVNDKCDIEPFAVITSQSIFALCEANSSPNVIISAFISNSSGIFQVVNAAASLSDSGGIGLDFGDGTESLPVWYISANANNQKYVKVSGLRTLGNTNPTPPAPINGTDTEGTNIINGIDCNLPEKINTVLCASAGTGAIPQAGAFIVGNGSEGTGITGIACGLGFTDCVENPDIKTNGIGYLFFIGGIALMMGLFLVISKGNLLAIPTFLWIISVLALAGAMSLMEIIDPVIFIITIVAVVALAVPKIVSTISGNTTLGAGNTS